MGNNQTKNRAHSLYTCLETNTIHLYHRDDHYMFYPPDWGIFYDANLFQNVLIYLLTAMVDYDDYNHNTGTMYLCMKRSRIY